MQRSIKDIARAAGVSHSTVSRALADSPLVNADTKARINRLAAEMGYSPDARARSLVMGHTRTVGVVVTSIADPFVAEVMQGIETTASAHGYSLILAGSSSDPEREIAAVEMLRSKRVDGVIVSSSRVGALYSEHLQRIGVPVVLLNNHSQQAGRYAFSVTVDNLHGAYLATNHLIGLGHRRIAFISGPQGHSTTVERAAGYQRALAEAGIPFELELLFEGDGRTEGGEAALQCMLARRERPTAVFCYNDMTAIGLLRAARLAGLQVPRDLAVAGFDDIAFASLVYPPLTTIAQPKYAMGEQAMQMALALMAGQGVGDVIMQGQLIVRESSVG
jgi:DNA-binding LacI/PurR family transcriptional regulator